MVALRGHSFRALFANPFGDRIRRHEDTRLRGAFRGPRKNLILHGMDLARALSAGAAGAAGAAGVWNLSRSPQNGPATSTFCFQLWFSYVVLLRSFRKWEGTLRARALNARILIRVPAPETPRVAWRERCFRMREIFWGQAEGTRVTRGEVEQSLWLSGVQTRPTITLPPRFAAFTNNP